MKRKILWLGLSFLLVASLVLASCAKEVPGEQEEEEEEPVGEQEEEEEEPAVGEQEEEEEPAVGEPQYGGTITALTWVRVSGEDPPSPDIADGYWAPTHWLAPIQDKPLIGDLEKYGPRGTGEYTFQAYGFTAEAVLKGTLLEDWEVTPDKVVWHIRPGVYWAADNVDFMENRELTAQDVVADLIYFRAAPGGKAFRGMSADIYATDRYTLEIEFSKGFNLFLMYLVGYEDRSLISPPEMIAAGADKWENQVGTGAFMFKEYIVGSHMSYVRNPNYWDTTTIDGVEYQLPFIDELIWPIVPDESTRIAALRTGTVDYYQQVPARRWADLDRTTPELLSGRETAGSGMKVVFKTDEPPFDDVNVRRAMKIGTDLKAFADLQAAGPLPLHWAPVFQGNSDVYIPLEELPADIRILFDYNPELARQMLADAGYPDGFKTYFYVPSDAVRLDRAALLKDQWAKIGVELEIKAVDWVAYAEYQFKRTFKGTIDDDEETGGLARLFFDARSTGGVLNFGSYSNERFDELVVKALAEVDVAERNRLWREASLILLYEVPGIHTDATAEGDFWWPWLKNYYGERTLSDGDIAGWMPYVWIDQDLKAEMGY